MAREPYNSALLAPLFIVMSFSFGLAIFVLVLMAACRWSGRALGDVVLNRLGNLLGVFVAAVLYFVAVYHLTNLYIARQHEVERFILLDGGAYTALFWVGQVLLGSIVPLALLFGRVSSRSRRALGMAALCVIAGGLAQLYVIIIGGQAYPQLMFPDKDVASSFFDGVVAAYAPSLPEVGARRGRRGARACAHRRGAQGAAVPAAQPGGRRRRFGRGVNRLLISAAHKSSGKTTVCIGLCAALRARGEVGAAVQERARTTSIRCGSGSPPGGPATTSTPT